MFLIILYPILTICTLFFLGFGLTLLVIPSRLRKYALWLTPWCAIIFLILALVILNLLGFSVKQSSPFIIIFLTALNLFIVLRTKRRYVMMWKEDIIILLVIGASIIFNLSPLLRFHKLPTTLSMGNNDVILYALVPDYLVNYSLAESFNSTLHVGVGDLLQWVYRWGPPTLTSFFLNLFRLQGYQFVSIFQVVLFALNLPLVYIFLKLIYKPTIIGLVTLLAIIAFNVNLLYILYHNFFGQILFWAITVFLLIFMVSYFYANEMRQKKYGRYDIIIGLTFAVLYFSYHEGVIFLVTPLILFFLLRLAGKKNALDSARALIRIFFLTVIVSSLTIVRGSVYDFLQARLDEPIGWQLFRAKIPFANPFEMMGFYSIHSFTPLPLVFAIPASVIILGIISYGFVKSKFKLFLISFGLIYGMFLAWFAFKNNFWNYNRALTYFLPFFVVLFVVGLTELSAKIGLAAKSLTAILIVILLFNAIKLNKRYRREHLAVDQSLISLLAVRDNLRFEEPIYLETVLGKELPLWRLIWLEYFLYGVNPRPPPPHSPDGGTQAFDNALILFSKTTPGIVPSRFLFKKIVWENNYHRLVRLCHKDECLKNHPADLSSITFGKDDFEDTLLVSGWSVSESESRWTVGQSASLRLITKNDKNSQLVFEALTIETAQKITIYLDDKYIGEKMLAKEWQTYSIPIGYIIKAGVHRIVFRYSHTYRPSNLGLGPDGRDLSANFKFIKLEPVSKSSS